MDTLVSQERMTEVAPYFDMLFTRLETNDPVTRLAFGRHVHWGCWADPASADGSALDYGRAAEAMCRRVCDATEIRDGMRILDVGCGFGGTIASLNERFDGLDMVGVNIDDRQLSRARQLVQPHGCNRICFVQGDACALPALGTFDVVLAVECIFHFPSRSAFLDQARRALRPGGVLIVSDFVPVEEAVPRMREMDARPDSATRQTFGKVDLQCSLSAYRELAHEAGLELVSSEDITAHTLPTYPFLRDHARSWPDRKHARLYQKATGHLEVASHLGWLRYTIMRFVNRDAGACVA